MMVEFIAKFSPRFRQAMALLEEVQRVFVAVEDLLHDQTGRNPKAQAVLNDVHDLQAKIVLIRRY
jgi:hypothetical protein